MTTRTRKELLPLIAIHEAGHVLVGERHRIGMRYVTLTQRPGRSEGHVMPVQSRNPGGYHCHHIMPTYAAGAIAQDIASGCKDRIAATRAGRVDFIEVRECARLVRDAQRRGEDTGMDLPPRATVRKIAEVAWMDAYQILTSEYGAVLALADALLSSTRAITRADCRRIIAGAGQVDPPPIAHLAESFWPSWFMPRYWVPAPRGKKLVA